MTRLRRTVTLDHKADDLFNLVSDIEKYPEFIRWIKSMDVDDLAQEGTKVQRMGRASVGFSGFSESFSTFIKSDSESRSIQVELVKGPLKHLQNNWTFHEKGKKTDVDFFIDFEFKNILLRALASANFELAFNRIMAAFVSEADRRYKS